MNTRSRETSAREEWSLLLYVIASGVLLNVIFFCFILLFSAPVDAADSEASRLPQMAEVSQQIQMLKEDVVSLNRDLKAMEEELLYPASSRLSVFVRLDGGQLFTLESVRVKLNGEQVVSHLYSDKQRNALVRGGVQLLHLTNLSPGEHTLVAFFTGLDANGRALKRATDIRFRKQSGSHHLQLNVVDDPDSQQPQFFIEQW